MHGGIRIGRLFGIELVIDWSWGLIFLFMSWNLTMLFGSLHPDWALGGAFLLAVVATIAFFACVLLHELAHSLVALAFGLRVRQIRMFLFGGVSDLEREPSSPGVELLMAIAGPVTSILLGLWVMAVAAVMLVRFDMPSVAALGPLTTLLLWLGPVNLSVGVFNLVPGFPLDGGRVLRAILWALTKSLHTATAAAAFVGRAIGWTFVAAGISMMLGVRLPLLGGGGGGLWIVMIGWFLASAARTSYGAMLVDEVLEGLHVSDLMRRAGWALSPDLPVGTLVTEWFAHGPAQAFPVVNAEGMLVGLVSVADVRKAPAHAWATTPVSAIMTPRARLAACAPGDDVEAALRRLGERDVNQLPVLDGETLVGMLSRADVTRWLELHLGAGDAFDSPRTA